MGDSSQAASENSKCCNPKLSKCFSATLSRVVDSGIVMITFSSVCFATMAYFVKLVSDLPLMQVVFIRSFGSWIFVLLHNVLTKRVSLFGPRGLRLLLMFRGTCGFFAMSLYFVSVGILPLHDAVVISFVSPSFTSIFAAIFLKEPLRGPDVFGCLLGLVGVALIARPSFLHLSSDPNDSLSIVGVLPGLGNALLSSVASILTRKIGTRVEAYVLVNYFTFLSMCFSALSTLGLYILNKTGHVSYPPLLPMTPMQIANFVAIGTIGYFGQVCWNRGVQLERAATAATMGYTQVVVAFLISMVALHEKPVLLSFVGTGLIILSSLTVAFRETFLRLFSWQTIHDSYVRCLKKRHRPKSLVKDSEEHHDSL
jgi:drug/metabolite transporter (DMT)-like permease